MIFNLQQIRELNGYMTAGAVEIVPVILRFFPQTTSVLDVGCGNGVFCWELIDKGVKRVVGIDGHSFIKEDWYIQKDFRNPWGLQEKFDIVLCFEVAEHLCERLAEPFIKELVSHGDTVLFSAATKGQGGTGHINEQPATSRHKLFASVEYDI